MDTGDFLGTRRPHFLFILLIDVPMHLLKSFLLFLFFGWFCWRYIWICRSNIGKALHLVCE